MGRLSLLLVVCRLLGVVKASTSDMPTSMPSQYSTNNISTMVSSNDKSAQQNHHVMNVEEIMMMMMMPSVSLAPSIQPTNNNNHASNDNEIPTMQPATQPSFASQATQQTLFSPLHLTRMPSPSRGIFPSALPSSSHQPMGNYLGRSTTPSRYAPSSSSCLMSQTQNSCFVSIFPLSKYKSQVLKPKTPSISNLMLSNDNMTGRRTNLWLRGSDNNIDMLGSTLNEIDDPPPPPGNNEQQLLILPLAMYSIVPFIPSAILSALNDEYLTLKGQFNIASASLLPNVATDSVEYLAAQDMYNDTMQSLFVLLLSKRLALYFLGTVTTVYAGWRASSSVTDIRNERFGGPGDHLDKLTEEVLKGEVFHGKSSSALSSEGLDDQEVTYDKQKNDGDKENDLFATLVDNNPSDVGTSLALGLPLVLGASLATSYLLTISQTTGNEASTGVIQDLLSSEYVPYLSSLPSAVLCLLFVATEFRWILPSDDSYQDPETNTSTSPLFCAGNVLALAYILGAYGAKVYPTLTPLDGINLDLWPLQNGVNIALAATVARALSPFLFPVQSTSSSSSGITSIRTVALALVGLTMFDGISTFGTVANAAEATTTATQSSMSVMESVARDKLASWQPGLLEIILGHGNTRVSEALGVGDVVFPSILVTWGFVADNDVNSSMNDREDGLSSINNISESMNNKSFGVSYTCAAIVGYLVGSFATEIVGSFSLLGNRGGLPALVFLVPSMLAAVTAVAWLRDELDEVWGVASNDGDT